MAEPLTREHPMLEVAEPTTPCWCIISVYRPHLLEEARRRFGHRADIEIVIDRRMGERRRPTLMAEEEWRATDRRSPERERRHATVDEQLMTDGFAIVPRQVL
jgi:hypothetical protein